jgi:probable F420-dependent oxidoreductase
MRYGMLLPHFGEHFSRDRILDGAQMLEDLGFDSLWVRDHLLWKPHGMEGDNRTFIEAFITLAAVAGVTKRIGLGTGVVIPIRWPLKVAHDFASLSRLAGREVEAGFGMGSNSAELGAAGFNRDDRKGIFAETVEICRRVWAEDDVSFHGQHFSFDGVTIEPKPIGRPMTWYGGTTRGSVRRAVAHCDGWLPGRLPMATLDNRLALLRELNEREGRTVRAGVIPLTAVDEDPAVARANVDIAAVAGSSEGAASWIKPPSGEFRTIDDLEGLLVSGTPEDCVRQIKAFEERGVETFIFDLRLQFDRFEEKAEMIARDVLPHLRSPLPVATAG